MDKLSAYKELFLQQLNCHGFYEEEAILNKMETLWIKMDSVERVEAERFITEHLPH